jgi:hypothetical protein
MRGLRYGVSFTLALGLSMAVAQAGDVKSGVTDKIGGPFQVKAFTGDNKGKELCYI